MSGSFEVYQIYIHLVFMIVLNKIISHRRFNYEEITDLQSHEHNIRVGVLQSVENTLYCNFGAEGEKH